MSEPRHAQDSRDVVKRAFDLIASATGLIILWPLIVLGWLVARADTGLSGFFIQERIGRYGRPFRVVKLRTMRTVPGIDATVTSASDARITRVGSLLRRTKLDELPQLWNVLMGDMSLVGPRPGVAGYADRLEGADREILGLRPGITGLATLTFRDQDSLLAEAADPERYHREMIWPEKVRLNRIYLREYSLWGDIVIILRTILRLDSDRA